MKLDEVPSVLDVHPPHEAVHGPRDFFLHLFTITIGLLIALGLEGLVEWQHHRHLAREAGDAIHRELNENAKGVSEAITQLHKEQSDLKQDIVMLQYIAAHGKPPEHSSMSVGFQIHTYNDVAWRTAQASNALEYMPYAQIQQYADIYATQDELNVAERQAARDAAVSLGPFLRQDSGPDPTGGEARNLIERIDTLQGQLLLVDNLFQSLDSHYKDYLASTRGKE